MKTLPLPALRSLALAALLIPNSALAQTATTVHLEPLKDNTIYDEGEESSGAGDRIFSGITGINANFAGRRALLSFDVASNIPAGAIIQSATLTLSVTNAGPGSPSESMPLHLLTKDWGEANSPLGPFGGGDGSPAEPGDATWTQNFFGTSQWTNVGGDFLPTASATTNVGLQNSSAVWTDPKLIDEVQAFLDNPATNFGWIIIGNELDSNTARGFASKEHATVAKRPKLSIEYLPPSLSNLEAWIAQFYDPEETVVFSDDLDGDGLEATFEYGAGLDPKTPNATSEAYTINIDGLDPNNRVLATFVRDPRATDMTYRMEASFDADNWFTLAESIAGAAPTGPGFVSDEPIPTRDPFRTVTVKHTPAFDTETKAFVRFTAILTMP